MPHVESLWSQYIAKDNLIEKKYPKFQDIDLTLYPNVCQNIHYVYVRIYLEYSWELNNLSKRSSVRLFMNKKHPWIRDEKNRKLEPCHLCSAHSYTDSLL